MPELAKDESVLDVLKSRTEKGKGGVSTGTGFYSWTDERKQEMRQKRITCHLRKNPYRRSELNASNCFLKPSSRRIA